MTNQVQSNGGMTSSKLLIDEHPLQVLPSLACALKSLSQAIVLQQVHYWISNNRRAGRDSCFLHGRYWVYNTIDEWQKKNFPFWEIRTIRRAFDAMEEKGIIISIKPKAHMRNHTKYYTINYEALNKLVAEWEAKQAKKRAQEDVPDPLGDVEPTPKKEGIDPESSTYQAMMRGIRREQEKYASGVYVVDVSEYPEYIMDWIRRFCELFFIDPPMKPRNGKGDFAHWINDAELLQKASAEFGLEALDLLAGDFWGEAEANNGIAPFTVARPGALIKAMTTKVSELRRNEANSKPVTQEDRQRAQERIRKAKERVVLEANLDNIPMAA